MPLKSKEVRILTQILHQELVLLWV